MVSYGGDWLCGAMCRVSGALWWRGALRAGGVRFWLLLVRLVQVVRFAGFLGDCFFLFSLLCHRPTD